MAVAHPELESGEYWVDPNAGAPNDAILVYCKMEEKATCIHAKPERTEEITWRGKLKHVAWYSEEISPGNTFTYKADSNQLTFLQILSNKAEQTITYHCKNSAAYYHKKKKTYRYGMKLMAWNDLEILPKGQKRVRYEVIQDDCKNLSDTWEKTVIKYVSKKPQRLPIVDVGLRDIGKEGQSAFIQIGDVCFS